MFRFLFKFIFIGVVAFAGFLYYKKPGDLTHVLTNSKQLLKNLPQKSLQKENFLLTYHSISKDNLVHDENGSYMAKENIPLLAGDHLFTGTSSMSVLNFIDDSRMRIDQGTKISILQIPRSTNSGLYLFKLEKGSLMIDSSDSLKKFAIKILTDKHQIYIRKATSFIEYKNGYLKAASDYGNIKITRNGEEPIFISEGHGLKEPDQFQVNEYNWVQNISWDQYFDDINKTGRKGPFTFKTTLLSKRNKQKSQNLTSKKNMKKMKNSPFEKLKQAQNTNNSKIKKPDSKVDIKSIIDKSGGKLLKNVPFYGDKIKEITKQIQTNTEAMKNREQELDSLDEN